MKNDNMYILQDNQLDRRHYPKLIKNNSYECEEVKSNIKNRKNKIIISKMKVYLENRDFYMIYKPTFDKHFKTIKQLRKEKLKKLNEKM